MHVSQKIITTAVDAAKAGRATTAAELVTFLSSTFKLELLRYEANRLAEFTVEVMRRYGN
jgi:hypothetical protein